MMAGALCSCHFLLIWVDDIGTVHVKWDTGSTLGAAFLVDTIRVVETS